MMASQIQDGKVLSPHPPSLKITQQEMKQKYCLQNQETTAALNHTR